MWRIAFRGPAPAGAVETLYRELIALWRHGDESVHALPERNRFIARYEELARDPRRVVHDLYAACGTAVSPEFDALLSQANARQRHWQSRHRYSLSDFPVCDDDLRRDLEPILARHRFS